MERWSGVLRVPLHFNSKTFHRVGASLCLSPETRTLSVPIANAIFFCGDRVEGTGNPVIERLSDLQKLSEIVVSKFGSSINAWVIEASVFNGPFAVYKDLIPSVNEYGEPRSYHPTGFPASTSTVSLLSNCLEEKKQRLQVLYLADFDKTIPKYVRLIDLVGNELEVALKKNRSRVYLAEGSQRLGQLYGLTYGGWLSPMCINAGLIYMRVNDRMGLEVQYPTPPRSFRLGEEDVPISIFDDEGPHGQTTYPNDEQLFFHALFKTLTAEDVTSSSLVYVFSFEIL